MALTSRKTANRRNRAASAATVLVATALAAFALVHLHHVDSDIARASLRALAAATALQVISILARAEAWWQCVRAAGGTVSRRVLYRCSSVGFVGNIINGGLGAGARIAMLRRTASDSTPELPALLAAELPVVGIDVLLGSLVSFTLVGPLSLPWWAPASVVALVIGLLVFMRLFAGTHERGIWKGLGVLRGHQARDRLVGLIALSMATQVARNWLLLDAVGLNHVGPVAAAACMVGSGVLGQLPIGPGASAAALVLILGTGGASAAASAGVLLTATGIIAALAFMTWAGLDLVWRSCPVRTARAPLAADLLGAGFCGLLLTVTAAGVL